MSLPQLVKLDPQSAAALILKQGQTLCVVDIEGEQVADIALFALADPRDRFSPGRTIDYNQCTVSRLGDVLYSNRSSALARIVADTVGVHDILLSPCSRAMFERRGEREHPSCHENLSRVLLPFELGDDDVTATLNVFMDVRVADNAVRIYPPPSRPGDRLELRAECDLIVAIAACSSELTNNRRCKPIGYAVL